VAVGPLEVDNLTLTPANTLTIGTGGLLANGAASIITLGNLSAGASPNTAATLYAYANNTATINSRIVDNGNQTLTTNTILGSGVVTVGSTYGLSVGLPVVGLGIPAGATIGSIAGDGTSFTLAGGTVEEILGWIRQHGRSISVVDVLFWNGFAAKRGWRDEATPSLEKNKAGDGLAHAADRL
jgi:hypothetical protein